MCLVKYVCFPKYLKSTSFRYHILSHPSSYAIICFLSLSLSLSLRLLFEILWLFGDQSRVPTADCPRRNPKFGFAYIFMARWILGLPMNYMGRVWNRNWRLSLEITEHDHWRNANCSACVSALHCVFKYARATHWITIQQEYSSLNLKHKCQSLTSGLSGQATPQPGGLPHETWVFAPMSARQFFPV